MEPFGKSELAGQRYVHKLQAGPLDGISAGGAKLEGRRRGEGGRVEPCSGRARSGRKHRLASDVRTNGVFTKQCSGVGGIAEDRDGERKSALGLIDRSELPI